MFEDLIGWLLLPLGGLLGWVLHDRRSGGGRVSRMLEPSPVAGDAALDPEVAALGKAIESATPGSVELELSLGALFRRRGELDRAIRLHEALLTRSGLTVPVAAAVRRELAQDYLRAGLMDRAEDLLTGLVAQGEDLAPTLELLLEAYEQGRDWPAAIETARRLQAVRGSSEAARIAQHHCEMAESARAGGDLQQARHQADEALAVDAGCARASFILAALAEAGQDWLQVIKAAQRAIVQDARFLAEALPILGRAYRAADALSDYHRFLSDAEADHPDQLDVVLARAAALRAGGRDAQAYLLPRLISRPDWRGLLAWLEGLPPEVAEAALVEAFRKRLAAHPRYACSGCGLQPSVLFWQCPGCKRWATITPQPSRA